MGPATDKHQAMLLKWGFAFVNGYKCFSSMYCIYQSLYLVHVFSNLSKEPFLVAVCCISLKKYLTYFAVLLWIGVGWCVLQYICNT